MDIEENTQEKFIQLHPISDMVDIPEELKTLFTDSWIDTVEQAVGYLSSLDMDIDGKDDFLSKAKELLGEDAFLKCSTPVDHPPLGCYGPVLDEKVVVAGSKEGDGDETL